MKFTTEDAYKELVKLMTAKGEKLNLSQRSINEQVEALLPLIANDETELADFVEKILPFVKTADANVRNDVSQGIKTYKDEQAKNQPKPQEAGEGGSANANSELLARLEALERKNLESELALKHQGIKTNLSSKMKELGIKSDKWIETMVGNVTITDDFDVEKQASDYLELYNSMFADIEPSFTPRGTSGSKNDYINSSIKEAAEIAKKQSLVGA
jgi:hypothetical protein